MSPQPSLVLTHGTVIVGDGAEPLPDASVVLAGERILDVVQGRTPDVPGTVAAIDISGSFVMPGLIDAHCHMTYGESRTQEEQDLYTGVEARTLRAAWNARRVLKAGVTSISQPGGSHYIGVALRDAIAQGYLQGPRMFTAGRYLTTSNGLTDFYPDSVGNPDGGIGILVNTLPEMINEVRHQVKNGVDLIKLADSPNGDFQAFTDEEVRVLTELVHQLGKKITIHARGKGEVRAAVRAGVDWIMHGNIMDERTVDELAASGIPLVPTLLLLANWADYGERVGVPRHYIDGAKAMLEVTSKSLHLAHAAGVQMIMGTDTGFAITPYGEWHARELELLMTYAGLSAGEAVVAATSAAAKTVGLDGHVGLVRPGCYADLLILGKNPLTDVRVLQDPQNIQKIVKGGVEQTFGPETNVPWPNDRAKILSLADLRFAEVGFI